MPTVYRLALCKVAVVLPSQEGVSISTDYALDVSITISFELCHTT